MKDEKRIRKFGNSYGITFDKTLRQIMQLKEETPVEIDYNEKRMIIKKKEELK